MKNLPSPALLSTTLAALLLLLAGPATNAPANDDETRTFTNDKGQTLQATVKGVSGDSVTLVLADGREFTIVTATLSPADQEYLKSMAAAAPAAPASGSIAPGSTPATSSAAADSDVSLEAINGMFGPALFADGDLWANNPEEVADRLGWPRESKTPFSSSFRAYPKADVRILGARPYSAALYGEDEKVTSLSIVFANKGDFFGAAGSGEDHFVKGKTVPDGIDGLRMVMERDTEAMATLLTEQLGEPSRQKFGEGETRATVQRWDWSGHAFLLSSVEDEYVSLAVQPTAFADERGRMARVSDAEVRERARANVETRENGDVVINNIPMVDQGPKGYCVPATAERCMRYLGIPADMYLLAMAGETQLGGGTSVSVLFDALERDVKRKGRSLKKWREDEIKIRDLAKYIDDGIPIMWGLYSTEEFNDIANERTQKRADGVPWDSYRDEVLAAAESARLPADNSKGHVVIIMGYNNETGEIAFSDSWGERYLERWITTAEASQISQGAFYVVDL